MLRVANSTPMVLFESMLNSLRVNREMRLDFPTPESPTSTTCNQARGGRNDHELSAFPPPLHQPPCAPQETMSIPQG